MSDNNGERMQRNPEENLVFLVDDDDNLRVLLERWLRRDGYAVRPLRTGEACLDALHEASADVICLDMTMPGIGGIETLARIREHHPKLPVVVLTADGTADTAVRAMKLGAHDYLTKPVDQVRLVTAVRNALTHGRLAFRVSQLEREAEGCGYPGIAGNSPPMRALFRQLDRLAVSDVSVLVHGESGTGKELVARAVHDSGSRRSGPFVAVNSAAIPDSLLESELFGHEKGAFTGALGRRVGRFEEAAGGTLFLDEVGELAPSVQAKLLRVLQERTFTRLGNSTPVHSDFRLITATHRDLSEEVRAGRFRQDLYFRLAVFELEVPALRERREDIPVLASLFLGKQRGTARSFSQSALDVLLRHDWPGNVRELQNVIQHATVVASGPEVRIEDLPRRLRNVVAVAGSERPDSADTLEDASRRLLMAALEKHEGNASAAMRELDIGRTRFYRLLRKYQLTDHISRIRGGSSQGV